MDIKFCKNIVKCNFCQNWGMCLNLNFYLIQSQHRKNPVWIQETDGIEYPRFTPSILCIHTPHTSVLILYKSVLGTIVKLTFCLQLFPYHGLAWCECGLVRCVHEYWQCKTWTFDPVCLFPVFTQAFFLCKCPLVVVRLDTSNLAHSRIKPRGVVADCGGAIWNLTPQSRVTHWVHGLLRVNVQMDTLHDVTEASSQGKR